MHVFTSITTIYATLLYDAARARIGEAFYRDFFKKKLAAVCSSKHIVRQCVLTSFVVKANLAMAPSVEHHLASLWFSNKNGKSKFAGGPSTLVCSASTASRRC